MRKTYYPELCALLVFFVLGLTACSNPEHKQLVNDWQVVSFYNDKREAAYQNQLAYIDSMTNLPSQIAEGLGTDNLDSAKMLLKSNIQYQKEEEEKMAKESFMFFQNDWKAFFGNGNKKDSAAWDIQKYETENEQSRIIVLTPFDATNHKRDTFYLEFVSSDSLCLRTKVTAQENLYIHLKPSN